jgi:steroid delta-isomerase-like uncharacterized protein
VSVEENKAVVRAFIEAWNARDLERFNKLMAEECTLIVSGETISCSPSATRAIATRWIDAFPDYRFELLDLIGEGDRVVAYMPWTGTQTGPLMNIPATGRSAHVGEIVIFRVVGGRIVEAWEVYDEYTMRQQLGVFPSTSAD